MQTVQNLDQIWFLVGAFLLGFLLAWLILPLFLRRSANKYQAQIESIGASLRQRERDLSSVRTQLDAQRVRAEDAEAEMARERAALAELEAGYDSATRSAHETQQLVAAARTDNATLQAELDEAKAAAARAGADRDEAQSELAAVRAAAGEAHTKLTAADQIRSDLESRLQMKADETDALAAKVADLEATNAELATKLVELEAAAAPPAITGVVESADEDEADDRSGIVSLDQDVEGDSEQEEEAAADTAGDEETYLAETRLAMVLGEGETVEDALWQREMDLAEARAEIEYLRASLSALTSISAELASTVDKRQRDHADMMAKLTAFLPDRSAGDVIDETAGLLPGETAAESEADDSAGESQDIATRASAPVDYFQRETVDLTYTELRELTEQLEQYQRDTQRYQQELDAALAAKAALEAELLSREEAVNRVSHEIAGLEARLETVTGDLDALHDQFSARNQAHFDMENRLAILEPELEEASAQKAALETRLAEHETERNALQAQLEELGAQLAGRMDELATLRNELDGQTAAFVALQSSVDEAGGELDRALADLLPDEDPAESVDDDPTRSAIVDTTVGEEAADAGPDGANALAAGVAKAKARLAVLRADLDAKNLALAETQDQLDTLTSERTDLTAQLVSAADERSALDGQLSDLQQTNDAAQMQLTALQAAIDDARSQLQNLLGEDEAPAAQEEAGAPSEETEGEAGRAALLGGAVAAAVARVRRQASDLADAGTRIAGLETTVQEKEAAIADLETQLDTLGAEKAELEAQIGGMHQQLEALQSELTEAEAAKTDLEAQLSDVEQAMADARTRLVAVLGEEAVTPDMDEQALRSSGLGEREVQTKLLAAGSAAAALHLRSRQDEASRATARAAELEISLADQQSAAQTQIAELAQTRQGLEAQLADLGAEKTQLLDKIQSSEADLTAARTQIAELKQARQGLEEELAALNITKDELTAKLADREEELTAVRAELDDKTSLLDTAPGAARLAQEIGAYPAAKRSAANAAVPMGALPILRGQPQDLTAVKNVDADLQQRLYGAGIGTYWELANAGDEVLKEIIGLTEWQLRSVNLEEIREDALYRAEATDSVGKLWSNEEPIDDLRAIDGIGPVYDRRLYVAGIRTYVALASASLQELAEACHAPMLHVPDYASWIEQARALVEAGGQTAASA